METILFLFHTEASLRKYSTLVKDISDCGYLTKSYLEEDIEIDKIEEEYYLLILTDVLPQGINSPKYRLLKDTTLAEIVEDINTRRVFSLF